ncbi:M16 family metallopeptidase [Chitinilyticum piscinae]|uniref:Insulinase family protein n=1 Tax=Chitinilyticum piscinae TaxID=2866724 RepID=A0A8J7FH42_9NEIS|nr:pitrilysin family protein [Chitinilyticum piscinae]MBE9608085.1 insulinase family protein [Chitinilyticum piscinae]
MRLSVLWRSLPLLLLLAGCATAADIKFQNDTQPPIGDFSHPLLNRETYTLDNGLRVVLHPDHRAARVETQVWYRVGALDEPLGQTGIAHALEHMMFRGTRGKPGDAFSKRVHELGGSENAFTTADNTYYFIRLPAPSLAEALQLEADRMANLELQDADFRTEIEVIKEERRLRYDNNPAMLLNEQLDRSVYGNSRPGIAVIGSMSDLESLTPQQLRDWYQRWYTPANATLVIGGDFDPKTVKALVQQYFGKLGKKAPPQRPEVALPQARTTSEPQRVQLKTPSYASYVTLRWALPRDVPPRDIAALRILASILASEYQTTSLAEASNGLDCDFSWLGREAPSFTLSATKAPDRSLATLEGALRKQAWLLRGSGLYKENMERAQRRMLTGQIFEYDSLSNTVTHLGLLGSFGVTPEQWLADLQLTQEVGLPDLERVATRYLTDEALTIAVLDALPPEKNQPLQVEMSHGR